MNYKCIIAIAFTARIGRTPWGFFRILHRHASCTQDRHDSSWSHNYDLVVTLFGTDNLAEDRYGVYDEDFVWHTDEDWYARWNAANVLSWNNAETPHWDVLGYDDADEWGLWDW